MSDLELLVAEIRKNLEVLGRIRDFIDTLLDRMTLRVPALRENVISDESRRDLSDLLNFRHFKRYYFDFEYDWDRIDFLLKKIKNVYPRPLREIMLFWLF